MIWDGMDFFGFDVKKVKRLDGKPENKPKWTDKFTSFESAVVMLATSLVFSFVIFYEGSFWWTQSVKSQTIQLEQGTEYNFNVSDSIPLMAGSWFYVEHLFPRINRYQ